MNRSVLQSKNKIRTRFLIVVFSFFTLVFFAQQPLVGKVLDSETKESIPFVNIGFIKQAVGTTTNENGHFILEFSEKGLPIDAILQVSSLGYSTKRLSLKEIRNFTNEQLVIYLEPSNVDLDEVVVFNDGQEFIPDKVGYFSFDENHFGYWKGTKALGSELATRIIAREGLRRLHRLKFLVVQPPTDSLLLRINIYDDDGGISRYPGTNLNKTNKNIFCKIYSHSKFIQVDLDPFEIVVEDDFIVSLELVKYYVKSSPEFALAASYEPFGSFRRYASQDKWQRFSSINMAFELETSLLVSKRTVERFKKAMPKREDRKRKVSGFIIANGNMIPNVKVENFRTGDIVYSNEKGRYEIHSRKGDVLTFQVSGFDVFTLRVKGEKIMNVRLKRSLDSIEGSGITPAKPPN